MASHERTCPIISTILGIALIILGVVAFAYQGITYTTQEKVIDLWSSPSHVPEEGDHSAYTHYRGIGLMNTC